MWKKLGPGVLLAGAAIGGSHLVASTQVYVEALIVLSPTV